MKTEYLRPQADLGSPDTRMERNDAGKMYWNPGDDAVFFLKQLDKRQEDLVGYTQAWNQQKCRRFVIAT